MVMASVFVTQVTLNLKLNMNPLFFFLCHALSLYVSVSGMLVKHIEVLGHTSWHGDPFISGERFVRSLLNDALVIVYEVTCVTHLGKDE